MGASHHLRSTVFLLAWVRLWFTGIARTVLVSPEERHQRRIIPMNAPAWVNHDEGCVTGSGVLTKAVQAVRDARVPKSQALVASPR